MKKTSYFLFFIFSGVVFGQNPVLKQVASIGFYNVENLWDTTLSIDYIDGTRKINDPLFHRSTSQDSILLLEATEYTGQYKDELLIGKKIFRKQSGSEEFTPHSNKNYTDEIYQKKLTNASKVISELGAKYTNIPPVIVGLVEVENRQVVEKLVQQPALENYQYGVVHFNSYDYRGIDVALIYQKRRFVVTDAYRKELILFDAESKREYTRDLLVVKGLLDGEKFAFFVNHWPSRRGGEAITLQKRNAAAAQLRTEMDAVTKQDPAYQLIAMGDFNDDPTSASIKKIVKTTTNPDDLEKDNSLFYNPMEAMYKKGLGTLAYRDVMNLFDQIIFSPKLVLKKDEKLEHQYKIYRTEIYSPSYLINKEGNYKGYPFRSWDGDNFTNGYSDHFPVFSVLQRSAE